MLRCGLVLEQVFLLTFYAMYFKYKGNQPMVPWNGFRIRRLIFSFWTGIGCSLPMSSRP